MRVVVVSIFEGVGWEVKVNGGYLGEVFYVVVIVNVSNIFWIFKIIKNCKDLCIFYGCFLLVYDWFLFFFDMGCIRSDVVGV